MDSNRFKFKFVNPVVNSKNLRSTRSVPEIIFDFAADKTKQWWEENRKPYLLAQLGNDLLREGINYKEALHPQGMKGFIQSASDRFKFVEDPIHLEKIGIIPFYEELSVVLTPKETVLKISSPSAAKHDDKSLKRRKIVNDFLDLVGILDDDDIKKIRLPLHILTKLRNLGDK